MTDLILFWHRRDLRTVDNVGLSQARDRTAKVVGVFCLDPGILERDDVAPVRMQYLMGSLEALQADYRAAGSDLLVLNGAPEQAIPSLAVALRAQAVYFNRDVEPYARSRDRQVADALKEAGVEYSAGWDQLLHPPKTVMTSGNTPYTVYTPFWRNWVQQAKAMPLPIIQGLEGLTPAEQEQATKAGTIPLPTAKDLGFQWDTPLVLDPGTRSAQERLDWFCNEAIASYDEQRNFPFTPGTSQLSAALKFGTIGIRTVWAATDELYSNSRSDETRANIRSWQQELAWREFYQHAMFFFPELAQGPYRQPFKNFPWENNDAHFQAWCAGRTGYPIVDAAMRQMNEVGWMHNRCRMITASFLTKDLIINWQLGEKYFTQRLMDWDLSANNGGWQWSASSGMDPKPLRIFNPASQAQKFDPEAEYIREWLPELRSVDTEALISGKIPKDERDRYGYPAPIVDHKVQQQRFKERYVAQKGAE